MLVLQTIFSPTIPAGVLASTILMKMKGLRNALRGFGPNIAAATGSGNTSRKAFVFSFFVHSYSLIITCNNHKQILEIVVKIRE